MSVSTVCRQLHRPLAAHVLVLGAALLLVTGCPDEEGFNPVGDDDDDCGNDAAYPEPIEEGHCHMQGGFFVSSWNHLRVSSSAIEQPGYTAYDCDADGDGSPDGRYYADPWAVDGLGTDFHWEHGGMTGSSLNGANQGLKPVIYVGGVRPHDAGSNVDQVFLWISYSGPATFWMRDFDAQWNETVTCNPIWSWNIDHHQANVPVVEDLDDLCAAAGIDSGNTQHPSRFGFFPLGVFAATTVGGEETYLSRVGTGADIDLDDPQPDQIRDTACCSTPAEVSTALTSGLEFSDLHMPDCERWGNPADFECTVFGDSANAYQPDDTLWGLDWDTFKGGNSNDNYEFVIRARDFIAPPASFEAAIESVQSSQYGFTSACGC